MAYAAVLYLRSIYDDGSVEVRVIAAKTKVTPLKKQSIPRLELLGALTLARFSNTVLPLIPNPKEVYFWVDSMTVLYWIHSDKIWKQYVQHRVEEIHQLTCWESWRHCPGSCNPADLPSRGVSANELLAQSLWWKDTRFLQSIDSQWPANHVEEMSNEIQTELVKNQPLITSSLLNTSMLESSQLTVEELIDVNQYSNLNHLLRVTAYVICFINQCLLRSSPPPTLEVTATEMNDAETLWIKSIQRKSFDTELCYLKGGISSPPLRVEQFGLFLDDDIIKCKGRINNSSLPLQSRNPSFFLPIIDSQNFLSFKLTTKHDIVGSTIL